MQSEHPIVRVVSIDITRREALGERVPDGAQVYIDFKYRAEDDEQMIFHSGALLVGTIVQTRRRPLLALREYRLATAPELARGYRPQW